MSLAGAGEGKGGDFVAVTSLSVIPTSQRIHFSRHLLFLCVTGLLFLGTGRKKKKKKGKIRAGPPLPAFIKQENFILTVIKWRNSNLWKTTQAAKHTSWGDLLKCFSVANEVKQTARERIKGLQQYLHNMTGNNEKRERPAVLVPLECKIGHSSVICR